MPQSININHGYFLLTHFYSFLLLVFIITPVITFPENNKQSIFVFLNSVKRYNFQDSIKESKR